MKKVYDTSKRFGGETGIWTSSPELEISFKCEGDVIKELYLNHTEDHIKSIDIQFSDNMKEFSGKVQEEGAPGPVDYKGKLLAN